jgi:hypothetical protein
VRQNRRRQFTHCAGPLAEAIRLDSSLHALFEQHLHPDADPQDRPTAGQPLIDEGRTVDRGQLIHHRRKRTDTGDDQSVRAKDFVSIGREFHPRAGFLQRLGRGVNVSASIVENHNKW